MNSLSYVETVFEHPIYDVGGAINDTQSGGYMGAWYYADRLRYDINDPDLQKHYDAVNAYFDDEANVHMIGWNREGSKAVVYITAHNISGSYYIYDIPTRDLKLLSHARPDLQSRISSDATIRKINTRDGESITAYHYYPENAPQGRPLLVMPHGGPHLRDYFDYDSWVQFFVGQGYQVVTMNFRGSSGYGREFEEKGFGEWGGQMQDDISDTARYFHDNGYATPDKTCIVGYSYGGYAALYGAATTPELYKCAVSGGGVSDLRKQLKSAKDEFNDESYEFLLGSIGDPKVMPQEIAMKSPVNLASQIDMPILLLHGTNDQRVEYEQSEDMHEALQDAGKDVTFVTLKNAYHSNWSVSTSVNYLESIVVFLVEHMGQP